VESSRAPDGAALVVALDGPSGSGKSSVARDVATALGLRYLDTGAMYRGLTWWMLREGVDVSDPAAVAAVVQVPSICSGTDPRSPTIVVAGVDVAVPIRGPEVTHAVSLVSAVPAVRARLVGLQQAIIARCGADDGGIVVEGRDIGTVVAPHASVKVFLTASINARADRRNLEVNAVAADAVSVDTTRAELSRRDRIDSTRASAPLQRAGDAIEIDTTLLDQRQVVAVVLEQVQAIRPLAVGPDPGR
jgi:cytidylate kinase